MVKDEKRIRIIFILSLILKGVFALFEALAGLVLLFTGTVTAIVSYFVNSELVEDPTDFIATHLRDLLPYLGMHAQLFGAFYLLVNAAVKLFLIWALIKNKLWAYPVSMIFIGVFMVYEIARVITAHSITMLFLATLDAFVLALVWHEYKYALSRKKH
jgi:uncharacterized membrane protein